MRYIRIIKIPLIWLALTLIISVPMVRRSVGSPGENVIYVDPSAVTAWPLDTPGGHSHNTFTVNIKVANVTDLFSWGLWFHWDPTIVNITGTFEGNFLYGPFTFDSRPTYDVEDITVTNPDFAYDGDLETYASFTYAQTSLGNFTLAGFEKTFYDYPIDQVDIHLVYSVEQATDDTYRIVYYNSLDPVPVMQTLVDWTSVGESLNHATWLDILEPSDGVWSWMDVSLLNLMVETQQDIASDDKNFRIYEAWATVTYHRPTFRPAPSIDYAMGYIYDGNSVIGEMDGPSGDGTVVSYQFEALTSGTCALEFHTPFEGEPDVELVDSGGAIISHTQEDGSFTAPPWKEDIDADGMVDIFDLAMVAIGYGKTDSDPNWPRYKDADVAPETPDGKIDIEDLVAVALKWGLGPYL